MKRKSTSTKFYLTLLLLIAVTSLKAQVITDLTGLGAGKAFCPSATVSLTATATGAMSYTWNRYAGKLTTPTGTATLMTSTIATMTDVPPSAGYYTYFSTSTNATGCISDPSDPTVIYVLPTISVSITPPATAAYCVNSAPPANTTLTAVASLSPTVSQNLGLTYQWQRGGADISGANASTYTLDNTDIATVAGSVVYTVKVGFAVPNTCGTITPATGATITINALSTKPIVTIN